jgi:DNA-binding response OmpR family regulator
LSKVLIVEDEKHLADGLRFNLEAEGYEVETAADGEAALALLLADGASFDVVVLDVMMPGLDGFAVAAELRRAGSFVPVLMLTARGRPEDVLRGFESGADDYLPKPFAFAELAARIQALFRRSQPAIPPMLVHDDLELDTSKRRARRAGIPLDLGPKEFGVLELLLAAQGRVVSTEELLFRVWDEEADLFTTAVKVTISRLRRKLGCPAVIETIPQAGYRI